MRTTYIGGGPDGGAPSGPAGGDLSGTYPNPTVIAVEETSGPTRLTVGAIPNQSLVARVGTALVAAALSGGLSFAAGTLTLSPVSNLTQGAVPAITAANAVLNSNGAGTAAVWTAISGGGSPVGTARTISTTAPLAGGGDFSADRTLTVAAVSNTSSGVVPAHAGAADVGKALIATSTSVAWGTDFGSQNLVTTGSISLGATPALTGALRLTSTSTIVIRETGNDRISFSWDTTYGVVVGPGTGASAAVAGSSVNLFAGGLGGTTALTVLTTLVSTNNIPIFQFGANAASSTIRQATTTSATGALFTSSAQDSSAVAGTGGARLDRAGDATGASGTRTGGAYGLRPGAGATAGGELSLQIGSGTKRIRIDDTGLSFFAVATVARQNITGSRGGNAALADLLTKLALTGLITDGTTA